MNRKGFTLIELLVVITILAVLSGAALPYVQNYVAEARIAKAKTDLEEISRAIAVYETREGEYSKDDVSDLTGRYLNKAPIDPWGKPYKIDTKSGLVISGGDDRDDTTPEDNITAAYQPPMALVSAKWVDKNQTGAVDAGTIPDEIKLNFSRRYGSVAAPTTVADFGLNDETDGANFAAAFDHTTGVWIATKTLVLKVLGSDVFTPGSDTIRVYSSTSLQDMTTPTANYCLASQPVKILPQ